MAPANPPEGATETPTHIYPAESWEIARNYSGLLGVVPSSFTSVIRSLINDDTRNKGLLSAGSRFMVERLAKSRSLKACLYYGGMTFQQAKVEEQTYLGERELVDLYRPAELAGIIGVAYLFKRARKLCDPAQFSSITNLFQMTLDMGTHVGYAIPAISPLVGFLAGGMPFLGLSPFLFYDRKGFVEYARHLRTKQVFFDYEYELQRWSCTSIQIASVMMQALGLGVPLAHAFSTGLTVQTKALLENNDEAYRFHIAAVWINSLSDKGIAPEMVHKAQYYPNQAALNRLVEGAKMVQESGSVHCWMIRGAHDVSPEATPQLFKEGAIPEPAVEAAPADAAVSGEELAKLETEIEDVLGEEEPAAS